VSVKRLQCPCGERLDGRDEDDLVAAAERHLVSEHPDLAGVYTREQILALSY
jgi:hypothetical protein